MPGNRYQSSPLPSRSSSSLSNNIRPGSPLPVPVGYRLDCMSAAAKRYKYLRRLVKFHQMDFEFAAWQMIYLFVSPQRVYRNFHYRKQTKSQFARDDPAFLVLLMFWLCASSVGFAILLHLSFWEYFKFLLYVVFVDCIGVGLLIATFLWFVTNRYMIKPSCRDQDVEWGYAFDVHLNAFFPVLIILHVFQLFFYRAFLYQPWFVARLFGNTLWLIALGYYIYITFLGYSCLQILQRTHILLYPLTVLLALYVITLMSGWNISQDMMNFYERRVT
ncbi:protein unc-50 homolog A [Schistocerca piceifrons]|uniref:protein unc-50 homolog A n=1 Tax=Schistocerca piceifrons TaxID=274613 RepID=UPI001F5EADBF|nr:protein unc-50 homolog A [Schistocerca piceifrons]XP_049953159.1 protein unc-50 homolog A [Schistocerca serialis cubense]